MGLEVERVADEVELCARQLQRRRGFSRLSAAALIRAMRFERAARLLRESDLRVKEAAQAVGYDDTDHFSLTFRHAYGTTPSDHTRWLLQEPNDRGEPS